MLGWHSCCLDRTVLIAGSFGGKRCVSFKYGVNIKMVTLVCFTASFNVQFTHHL